MTKYTSIIATVFIICIANNGFSQEMHANSEKLGKIEFPQTVHDFGIIENGGNGTYVFEFKNTGSIPVTLENVRSSCGCTIPTWPREAILPGNVSSIKVKYDTKRTGAFTKTITVYTNAEGAPISLKIKGTVKPVERN